VNGKSTFRSELVTVPFAFPELMTVPFAFPLSASPVPVEAFLKFIQVFRAYAEELRVKRSRKLLALIGGISVEFETAESKFEALASDWVHGSPSGSIIALNNLSHLQIIGMGEPAIPFLISRVAKGQTRWIAALKCITGEQAETAEMHGDFDKVVDAWTAWGKKHGYLK